MALYSPKSAEAAGAITSGAPSPTLGYPIAMGYLSTALPESEIQALEVDIRGSREPVAVEPLPFYSRTRKKGLKPFPA
jgi:aminomethyltransferase